MNEFPRLHVVRSRSKKLTNTKAPAVAQVASRAARIRYIEGLAALAAIKDPEQLAQARRAGIPLNIDGFKKWKKLGSGALYETNRDLKIQLDEQCQRLQKLAKLSIKKTSRPATKRDEIRILRVRIFELERLLAARDIDFLSVVRRLRDAHRSNE